jgi:hypothetical protein
MANITLNVSAKITKNTYCDAGFLQMMVNRCIVGYYRYGSFRCIGYTAASSLAPMDRLKGCLAKYEKTGNRELLVDSANYLMSEFVAPHHPKAHLKYEDQGVR